MRWLLCVRQPPCFGIWGREWVAPRKEPVARSALDWIVIPAECSCTGFILTLSLCNRSLAVNLCAVLSLRRALSIRWSLGSRRVPLPAITVVISRPGRWIGILVLYTVHKGQFNCPGGGLLHSYLLGLLILLASIICALSALVYISMQGKQLKMIFCV